MGERTRQDAARAEGSVKPDRSRWHRCTHPMRGQSRDSGRRLEWCGKHYDRNWTRSGIRYTHRNPCRYLPIADSACLDW